MSQFDVNNLHALRELSILPKPRCSSAFLFSIINSCRLRFSFSLCLRESSRCKNAHLSSTNLDISATAALTKTSMIEDSCVWKGAHVAMLFHLNGGTGKCFARLPRWRESFKTKRNWRIRNSPSLFSLLASARLSFRVAEGATVNTRGDARGN